MFDRIYKFMFVRGIEFEDFYYYWFFIPLLFILNDLGIFDVTRVMLACYICLWCIGSWSCLILFAGHPSIWANKSK